METPGLWFIQSYRCGGEGLGDGVVGDGGWARAEPGLLRGGVTIAIDNRDRLVAIADRMPGFLLWNTGPRNSAEIGFFATENVKFTE